MTGKIISVAQQKGGAGKSTLAAHLAVALRLQGHPVGLVDIDPQKSLAYWFDQRSNQNRKLVDISFEDVDGWQASRRVQDLAEENDFVLVDCPPHAETDSKIAIRAADLVVMPVQPSSMDFQACRVTRDLAAKEDVPAIAVFNRLSPHQDVAQVVAEFGGGQPLTSAAQALGNRVAYARAMAGGLTVLEMGGAGKAADEVRSLSVEILRAFA
ncbi:ParA family partition ATPase [Aestuariispira ectoiniformans]|uniref:ParA family partition ATPase n=1 Tax=Aestuariispira ectoiniformans TaxID=2775080 RepID=UPI00223AC7C0|nr:ParA family partition ATPase [Aestuariispira ectoiniformans]